MNRTYSRADTAIAARVRFYYQCTSLLSSRLHAHSLTQSNANPATHNVYSYKRVGTRSKFLYITSPMKMRYISVRFLIPHQPLSNSLQTWYSNNRLCQSIHFIWLPSGVRAIMLMNGSGPYLPAFLRAGMTR